MTRRPRLSFALATPEDAAEIAALHTAAAIALTERFGPGHWSNEGSERGIIVSLRKQPRFSQLWVARRGKRIVGSFRLATMKPWAIDRTKFPPARKPLYLTGMVVDPRAQGQGIGRSCVERMIEAARAWPADAIRLDAYDHAAGAGEFYARCGFREVERVVYRGDPLVYYDMSLASLGNDL